MSNTERPFTPKESLDLIAQTIAQAKQSYYETGLSAMMWGIVIAVCSLVRLSEIEFGYRLPVDIYWLTVIAVVPQVLISIREGRKKKVRTYDDIYMDYLWLGFGISIFLMIFIINAIFNVWPVLSTDTVAAGERRLPGFYEFVAPLFLLLYGIPTFITGAACKFRAMLLGGLLCWACCIITIYTTIKIDLVLTAFSAIAAWFIPGIVMQKEYRRAKRELAKDDV